MQKCRASTPNCVGMAERIYLDLKYSPIFYRKWNMMQTGRKRQKGSKYY